MSRALINRRDFVKQASVAVAALGADSRTVVLAGASPAKGQAPSATDPFKYRVFFGAWINDMRREPLPLENWPAPQFDDEAVASAIGAMDVQSAAGYNMLDVWGLFATYGWPTDIVSAVDKDRRKRIHKLQGQCHDHGRLASIRRSVTVTLNLLNTISYCLGEAIP